MAEAAILNHWHGGIHGHGGDHGHGLAGGHTHSASDRADADPGKSLLSYIDKSRITCLNEDEDDSCQAVFKDWSKRLDFDEQTLSSDGDDDDARLILKIPFNSQVRLRSFQIVCQDGDMAPTRVKLYKDVDSMDFSSWEDFPVTQEFELFPDEGASLFYHVHVHKFNNIGSLTMFFDESIDDAEQVTISYINLQGEFTANKARAVETLYESSSIASDHKNQVTKDSKNDYIA